MTAGRVVVLGSVNVDLVATVERLPAPGETVIGGSFAQHQGGKGGNQATAAARLGGRVAFVGAVGDDAFGTAARSALQDEGIDLTSLASVDGPTGVALILVDARGENAIAVASGANEAVSASLVESALADHRPGPGDVVLACNEIPGEAVAAALRVGRAWGATTILNPAPASGLDPSVLDQVDVLIPNRGELELLARAHAATERAVTAAGAPDGANDLDAVVALARTLLAASRRPGVRRAVIVTLGSHGAVLVPAVGADVPISAVAVDAVDTVGAGDTFVGALAADLAAGKDLEAATVRAVAAAGLSTTRPGARGGMPTGDELERFIVSTEGTGPRGTFG